MNRQEMATVLSLMKMNYPSHFKSISSADASMLLDFWTKELSKFDYETVCNAVHTVIRKSEFCPTISQVLEQIKIDTRDYTLVEYEKCKICGGTGLIQYVRKVDCGGKLGVMEVICCCRCSCNADSKSSIPTYRQVFGVDAPHFEPCRTEKVNINDAVSKIKHIGLYSEHEALNGFTVADKEEENNEKTRCKSKLGNAGSNVRKDGY